MKRLALASICLALVACSGGGSIIEKSFEASYEKKALRFGEAIMNQDYSAAYTLASSHLKNRMSYADFEADCKAARAEYGPVIRVEASVNSTDPKTFADDKEIVPSDIPQDAVRAWTVITLALEVDGQGEIERCYDYWAILVEEEGETRVGSFYHDWCD